MGPKHKHYDVIVAWANGEEIQRKSEGDPDWVDSVNPVFSVRSEYRIKPKRVKKEGWVNIYPDETVATSIYSSKESADHYAGVKRIACVRIEWEGEA